MKRVQKRFSFLLMLVMLVFLCTSMQVEAATKVKISKTKQTMYVGQTTTLKVSGTREKVDWSSSNQKVATVTSKGKVSAKKSGTATITAKVLDKKYTCKVTVKAPVLNATSKKLDIGKSYTLKLTGAKAKTYTSSNTKIATVTANGKITAKKSGTATITVKDTNGKKYACKITVNKCKHTWNSGKVTKKASCTATGTKTYTCKVCKETKTENVKKLSHKKAAWEVTTPATCVKSGTKVRKCTMCKKTVESKGIAPTGHEWKDNICTKCGATGQAGKITILYPGDETARFSEFLENEFAERVMKDIGLEIEMIFMPWDQYWTQKEILLTANVPIDLYWDGWLDLAYIANNGYAQPLDELLKAYGQDLVKEISMERLESGKINGKIYGIPSAVGPSSCQSQQVCVRQDILEAVGMDSIKTADDLYQFAAKAKEQFPELKGPADVICKPLTRAFQTEQLTWLRESYYKDIPIAVYGEDSKKVYSYYETETFQEVAKFNQKMYDEGLYGDELTTEYSAENYRMQQGDYIWMEGSFGKHMEMIGSVQQSAPEAELNTYLIQPETDKYVWSVSGEGLYIPYSAENPEGAITFLNWLYGSKENHQFAIYGVEGKDYFLIGDRIIRTTYEDFFYEWMFRHQDYTLFSPDIEQSYIDSYRTWDTNAKVSDTLGFVFNNENVIETEVAIREVISQYMFWIQTGFINFDENYPTAVQKLKEAGIDEYIAEVQRQFDEFMANK